MITTLQIGDGSALELQEHGISGARLLQTSQGEDTLSLTVGADIDASAIIAPFQKCILRDGPAGDATDPIRFVGWLDQAPRRASGTSESCAYTLTGPWRWLDRYQVADAQRGGLQVLGLPGEDNNPQPIDTVLRTVLRLAAVNAGAVWDEEEETMTSWGEFSFADADLAASDLQAEMPLERRIDDSAATLVRAALAFAPTVAYWWEGTQLRFRQLPTSPDRALGTAGYELIETSVNPRYDLLHDTVRIYWLQNSTSSLG